MALARPTPIRPLAHVLVGSPPQGGIAGVVIFEDGHGQITRKDVHAVTHEYDRAVLGTLAEVAREAMLRFAEAEVAHATCQPCPAGDRCALVGGE